MQCDICFRTGERKLPFLCPTDARNHLYPLRLQSATVLVEKDALDRQVNTLLASKPNIDETHPHKAAADVFDIESLVSEREQSADRTQQIIAQADELRTKVEKAKEEIAKKKALISRRKSELASASNGTEPRRMRQVEEVEKSTRMTKYKWNQIHSVTATSRAFLCGEAAKLYGLRRVRQTGGRYEYQIGGLNVVDLRSLNTASPAQISTTLSHIVHLLMLSTHYLAIRLPAEITLPHRDYPLPTIFPLLASYKHTDVPFPGSTLGHSSNNSPTASRHLTEQPTQPRPRPLYITKPLPKLAAEDPAEYALFIEAITLLAYDVAWLCKSQGIPVGENSAFEDICNIGKNFFNLLIGSQPRPSPGSRVPSAQSTPTKNNTRDGESEVEEKKAGSLVGRFSHGSAHSFLGNADGTDFIRSWKLLSPMKLADKLKAGLMSEVANAEWEVVEQHAWEVEDEMKDDGVVVGARREGGRGIGLGMESFMSMRTVVEAVEVLGGDGERKPGTSGWTKVKPR